MLRARPMDESLEGILGKSNSSLRRGMPSNTKNTAPKANSPEPRQRPTEPVPPENGDDVMLGRKSSSRAAKVGQTVTKGVRKGVGAAGKGTVKATHYVGKGVGKGVGVAGKGAKGASKLGAKTAKGTFTATKLVAKNTVRVGKGTVGAVTNLPGITNLPGNAIHLAQEGINNLAAWTLKKNEVAAAAAWKTRMTSPFTKVELVLECHNLRRKDAFAECDAFCVLWQVPSGYGSDGGTVGKSIGEDSLSTINGNLSLASITSANQSNGKRRKRPRVNQLPTTTEKEIGRTEIVKGSCNPEFTYKFVVDFKFQEEQTYVIRVYDSDLEFCPDLKEHDFLGGTVFTMGELMGVGRRELRRPLRSRQGGNKSKLVIRGNEETRTRSVLQFRFNAQGLRESEKAVLDKDDDPYFKILKLNREDQSWEDVYKSEVLMHNNTPTWAKARLPLPVVCNNEMTNPLRITFWDWRRAGEQSESLGYVETTVQQLVDGAQRGIPVFSVQREIKRYFRRDKVQKSGQLKVLRAELQPVPTMAQYICGGCNIDVMIAVDCSVSNGDPLTEEGLHFREGLWMNDYQAAIHKIGTIMEPYSHSGDFTINGFGGDIRGEQVPLFPMGTDDGVVHGANGLLDAYDETFTNNPLFMEPADEANIAPLIQSAMYRAIQNSEREHCYSVLCVLTAGTIGDDLRETIDTICTAAEDAPLSIIIIGVGENQTGFETIEQIAGLAREGKLRHSNGVPISRDNLGFASFNDFEGSAGKVVAESLKDLPEQFVEYFTNTGMLPRPPQTKDDTMKDESNGSMNDSSRRSRGSMNDSSRRSRGSMDDGSRRRTDMKDSSRRRPRGRSKKKSSRARASDR